MFAAMASVAFASCVKNEPLATLEQGDLITFEVPVVAPATKATGTVEYPGTEKFVLYGWYHASSWDVNAGNNAGVMYIPGVNVSKHGEESYFRPNDFYYWPKTGNLSFFAYSPAALLSDKDGNLSANCNESTIPSVNLTYTVPSAQANQVDLLYSDWALNKSKEDYVTLPDNLGAYNGVEIVFNHALSAVLFNLQTTEKAKNLYKIHSVSLSGLHGTSTLTSTPATTSWGELSYPATYAITPYKDQDHVLDVTAKSSDMFMLLPQSLEGAKLTIRYSLLNPGDRTTWISQEPKELSLNTATNILDKSAITAWESGRKYTYNLVFDVDLIQLAPSIKADWIGVGANLNTDPAI